MKHNFFKFLTPILLFVGLGISPNAWAIGFRKGNIVFDATDWTSTSNMSFVVGKDVWQNDYSSVYPISTHISNTNLYYGWCSNGDDWWNGCTYFGVVSTSTAWGNGSWGSSNLGNASYYTAAYTDSYDIDKNGAFLLVPASTLKGAAFSISYSDNPSGMNKEVKVGSKIKTAGSSSYSDQVASVAKVYVKYYEFSSSNYTPQDKYSSNYKTINSGATGTSSIYSAYTSNVNFSYTNLTTGYQFDGWYDGNGNQITDDESFTELTKAGKTVYAYFSEITYSVTAAQGTGCATISPTGAQTVGQLTGKQFTAMGETGYHFVNWTSNNGGTFSAKTSETTTFKPVGNATITANYEEYRYAVSATYGDGGKSASVTTTPAGQVTGTTISAEAADGYVFSGWTIDSGTGTFANSKAASTTYYPTSASTLLATFARATVTVNSGISSNHATLSGASTSHTITIGTDTNVPGDEDVTFTVSNLDKGYQIEGWYTNSGYTDGKHDVGQSTYVLSSTNPNKNVYVKITPITYTITYNENGGTTQTDGTYTIESATITLPTSTEITRTNYTFLGWFDNSQFTGDAVTTILTGSTGNKQYWAKWEETKYAVTLVGAQSPASPVQVGNVTAVQIVANDPTPGYYFSGWTVSGVTEDKVTFGNNKAATTTIKVSADGATITANFAPRFYLRGSSTDNEETKKGMPGWGEEAKTTGLFSSINGNTATITMSLNASTEYKLKLGDMTGNSWGGSSDKELTNGVEWQFTSHEENCNAPTFRTAIAGAYTFTIDFSETNPKMKIDYPEVSDFTLTVDKARKFKETTMQNFIAGDGTGENPYQFYLDEKMTLTVTALPAVTGVTAYYKFGDDAESSTVLTKEITAANTTVQSIVVKTYYKGNIGSYTSAEKTETIYYQGVAVPALHLSASWNEKEESELSENPEVTIYYSADNYSSEATVTSSIDGGEAQEFMQITTEKQKEADYQMADNNPHRYDFEATATVNNRTFKATTSVSIYRLVEVRIKDTEHLMTKYYMWINGSEPIQYEKAWPGNDFIGKLGDWHIFLVKYPSYTHFVLNNGMNWGDKGAEQTEDIALPDHNTCYEIGEKYTEGTYQYKYKVTPTETCPDILYVGNIADVTLAQGESQLIAPEVDLDYGYNESQLEITFPNGLPSGFTAVQQGKKFLLTGTTQCAATTINVTYTLGGYSINKSFQATVTHPSSILIQVSVNTSYGWNAKDQIYIKYFNHDVVGGETNMAWHDYHDNQDYYSARIPVGSDGKVDFMVHAWQIEDNHKDHQTTDMNNVDKDGCFYVASDIYDGKRGIAKSGDFCWQEYQVKINMASGEEYESNAVENLNDIVSFYAPGVNETGTKSGLVRIMRNGTQVAVVSADKFNKSGVYTAKITANGADLSDVAPYTGDYYIRTDGAEGGWNEYKKASHKFTNFSLYDGAKYNYYWTKNVKNVTSLNVKARVANEYNKNLAVMLVKSSYTDDDGNITGINSGTGVNLRFGYNPETNYFERAILRGSTDGGNYFLNVQGDNVFNDANCTQEMNESNYTSHPEWSKFNDVSDWVYEKLIYVKIDGSHPSASILLKSKDFNDQVMYQLGYTTDYLGHTTDIPVERTILGQGTAQRTYALRVIYDYKTNRLSASWEPEGEISEKMKVDADILFVSNEGERVKQVTFANDNAELNSLQSVMYVLEITGDISSADAQYWMALPFECKISDIFGIENYITLDENRIAQSGWWGIMRYRGDLRAEKGWFEEDTPEGFWEWMYPNESLVPGEGYVLYVEKKSLKWESITVEEPCTEGDGCTDGKRTTTKTVKRFYFPSLVDGFTMSRTLVGAESQVTYPNQTCSKKGREAYDSNWKVIAPKSYDDIKVTLANEYTTEGQTTWPNFIYEYNPSNRTYTAVNGVGTFVYQSFHGYMAQYAGTITWQQYSKTEHKAPRFAEEPDFKGGTMTIELVQNNEQLDHTFVQLNKFGTEGFDQNLDLTKITENCAQIASVSEDVLYAGNTLPLDIEMVPLNVKVVADGTYDIALEQSLEGLEVRLYDAFEQTTTPLDLMSATVTLDKGEYKDRFFLQFVQKSPQTPTNFNGAIEQFNLPTDKTQKLLINDNIYLINAGRIYNASGTQVK